MNKEDVSVADQFRSLFSGRSALILEDEPEFGEPVREALLRYGFADVVLVARGDDALKLAIDRAFDVLILDRQVPGINGLEVLRGLRAHSSALSRSAVALIVSMMGNVEHRLEGISAGAKDYIPKPVDGDEVAMRLAAQLMQAPRDQFGGFSFDAASKRLMFGDVEIDLGKKDLNFRIMAELIKARGVPISKIMLWDRCWTNRLDFPDTFANIIDSRLSKLRRQLADQMRAQGRPESMCQVDSIIVNEWAKGFVLRDLSGYAG